MGPFGKKERGALVQHNICLIPPNILFKLKDKAPNLYINIFKNEYLTLCQYLRRWSTSIYYKIIDGVREKKKKKAPGTEWKIGDFMAQQLKRMLCQNACHCNVLFFGFFRRLLINPSPPYLCQSEEAKKKTIRWIHKSCILANFLQKALLLFFWYHLGSM